MDKNVKKVSVPVATPSKSFKKYYQSHTTTLGFMKPRPIFAREYVPNRDMTINYKSFIRANPMPVPIFGRVNVHNRAFYVPFRTIMPDFNHGIENTIYNYYGQESNIPGSVVQVTNNVLVELFLSSLDTENPLVETSTVDSYDICDSASNFYKFTDLGLDYLTILYSLGYKINWNRDDEFGVSALPLMAYAKILLDWYYPSAYFGDAACQFVDRMFRTASYSPELDSTQLRALLSLVNRCSYDNDYFVAGWDYPIGPNQGIERSLAITDITIEPSRSRQVVANEGTLVGSPAGPFNPTSNTPFIGGTDSTGSPKNANGVLSQYVINALRSLTDYTLRHRLSGVRALDRYLTEYNVKLKDEILARSMYLGDVKSEMEFYDVFSNSDTLNAEGTAGKRLGDFAGRGQSWNPNGSIKVQGMDEFGMVIIVNTIIPEVSYTQGVHREMMHVNFMDFWHPDYDHMIVQPISKRELYVPVRANVQSSSDLEGIFAYTSKYIETNMPKDTEGGLYLARSRAGMLPCYTLKRDLSYLDNLPANRIKHNVGFVMGEDADSYNRIFYVDGKTIKEDQFNAIFQFEVVNNDSTLPPYDSVEFEHKNKEVEIDVNGARMN